MTAASPLVTVAMSVRNSAPTVGLAIRSILAQTLTDFELVVTDDGSTDATPGIVAAFADSRIHFVRDGATSGLAARLNEIGARAHGRYIARMDGDDFAYPDRFARQVAFLNAHPGVDLVGSSAVAFRPDGTVLGAFRVSETHAEICARPSAGFPVPHPTWMARADWFRRFPYDAGLTRGQDQAKLLSAYRQSRFANLPEPLLGYRQDIPKVAHITQSRLPYLRAFATDAARHGNWTAIPAAAIQQIGRTAVAVAELSLGRGEKLLARRFRPLTHDEARRFDEVARSLAAA